MEEVRIWESAVDGQAGPLDPDDPKLILFQKNLADALTPKGKTAKGGNGQPKK